MADTPDEVQPSEHAPADWQEQIEGALEQCSELCDDKALRLLALPSADLSAEWYGNTAVHFIPDPRPTAGEALAIASAYYGRARVLRWLAKQGGVNLLAARDASSEARPDLVAAANSNTECIRFIKEHVGTEALRAADSSGWMRAYLGDRPSADESAKIVAAFRATHAAACAPDRHARH